MADVSVSTFQSYVRSDRPAEPSLPIAYKICQALGLEFYIGPPPHVGRELPEVPVIPPPVEGMGVWPAEWLTELAAFFSSLPDECPLASPGRDCPLLAAARKARRLG